MTVTPSRVNFDNVTSLGVSYDWSYNQGSALPCPGITNQEGRQTGNWVERVKSIDLEVANLDLNNAGGEVIAQMAAQQAEYVNTASSSIYANGHFAGYGYLTSYSIGEGSLSNSSVTNLSYTSRGDGDPNEEEVEDDPVTRSESIKVTRDIKGKSYTIDHSYSVSYGSDYDLVTNYPLYSGNPEYKSVDGRLALAEKEALSAVNNDITNYGDYIDLSPYTLGSGFDLTKINNGCSGVFTTSNETKNFINGDFSYSKQIVLKYTGANLESGVPPYEIDYSIDWSQSKDPEYGDCLTLKFNGNIKANQGSVLDCSSGSSGVGAIAQSGFEEWVTGPNPKGAQRVQEFFDALSGQLSVPAANNYPLVSGILGYKKEECVPSVDQGAKNDGAIKFEFEMSSCPNQKTEEGSQYEEQRGTSFSFSKSECNASERKVTEISVDGSVAGLCGRNIDENGNYQRWNLTEPIFNQSKASGLAHGPTQYEGPFTLRLASQSTSINKYEGSADYTYTWTDSPNTQDCEPVTEEGCNDQFAVSSKETLKPSIKRYVNTVTAAGIISEEKGETLASKSSSVQINTVNTGQEIDLSLNTIMDEVQCQFDLIKPTCAIQNMTIDITKNQKNGYDNISANGSIEGINI